MTTINGIELNGLLDAILRVEHNYMTLRTPEGWLLWSQKVTSECALGPVLSMATASLSYKQAFEKSLEKMTK